MNIVIEILQYILLAGIVFAALFATISLIIEHKRLRLAEKTNDLVQKTINMQLKNNIDRELFEFNILQKKSELLKRNSGHNPCEEQMRIRYTEYCDTVCLFDRKVGE